MDTDRLAKLLALSSSPNDQEALAALRSARRLLMAAGLDFVDLGQLIREGSRAGALEQELEVAHQQTQKAELALRATRNTAGASQVQLRLQLRQLTLENQTLKTALQARSQELEAWQSAHQALDSNLRKSSQERFDLKTKLRQKQKEIDQIMSEVRGMLSVTTKLRSFMEMRQ